MENKEFNFIYKGVKKTVYARNKDKAISYIEESYPELKGMNKSSLKLTKVS
jgi:hypothetical protein